MGDGRPLVKLSLRKGYCKTCAAPLSGIGLLFPGVLAVVFIGWTVKRAILKGDERTL